MFLRYPFFNSINSMNLFKEDKRDYSRCLNNMLTELNQIKTECTPDEGVIQQEKMDKYQKKRLEFFECLQELTNGVMDAKQKTSKKRDQAVISLDHKNRKLTKQVFILHGELKKIYESDCKGRKAKKLGNEELEARKREVEMLEEKIKGFDVNKSQSDDLRSSSSRSSSRLQHRREERLERKKRKKERRRRNQVNPEYSENNFKTVEMDAKTQAFQDEVNENRMKEDEMLDQISIGLTELKELSKDINNTLKYQSELLQHVDDQMVETQERFATGNEKLQDLLDAQGGVSKWIPRLCCLILLLSIIGYMAKLAL